MAYSELIKNFDRIRDYMRQFYVYGFKSRTEYDRKSARSYDNERRRIESWLGPFMGFRKNAEGKNVFLSVDTRSIPADPLYNAFKAKSFTSGDVTFHFYILDVLSDGEARTASQILDAFSEEYFSHFSTDRQLDLSSLRKKLKEYVSLGLLVSEKRGRELLYRRSEDAVDLDRWADAVAFFSEADPLGVIGSTLLDKLEEQPDRFRFKHHYMLHALDSQILLQLLTAIGGKRQIRLTNASRRKPGLLTTHFVIPLQIWIGTQDGRQYLLCHNCRFHEPQFFRLDYIQEVELLEEVPGREVYARQCEKLRANLWGTSTGVGHSLDRIEMTVRFSDDEPYIPQRLEREKRCGKVERTGPNTCRFTAEVCDASELLPWIRTFIGRIESLECTDQAMVDRFYEDLAAMTAMYGGET